jgi:hypothetical protein
MKKIEVNESALDSLKAMVQKLQDERDAFELLLLKSKNLLDRYRLETPMGNQPHMITLEAYEHSKAIAACTETKQVTAE